MIADDATTEITLRCYLTVRVRGEQMDDEQLAGILDPYRRGHSHKLEREVARCLRLHVERSNALGWTPDDTRQAFLDELLSVDLVEEVTHTGLVRR
jgi:hypothetical protein